MIIDRDAECPGDGIGGDVVVRRPDAPSGENIRVAGPQRVDGSNDLRFLVRHHPHLFEIDADSGEVFGDKADVLVLGPARQDFVADDQEPGSDDLAVVFRCGRLAHLCQPSGPHRPRKSMSTSNRIMSGYLRWSMICRKPATTFRDHALARSPERLKRGPGVACVHHNLTVPNCDLPPDMSRK